MSIQVTSTNGRTVNLEIELGSVVASSGQVKFMADKTDRGLESRFLVPEAGNRRIEVALTGRDLEAANALFSELAASVEATNEMYRELDAERAQINKALEG
ncbi:hypothetical protein [Pseudomonas aeruginosa]|uniref:hypothetical protein n=1 Tax=Pseudomonas aeruginosa TaxID=287 RepID=UPI00071B567D|nr:hypothetical protein [Pseudomonas aeruginosa]EKU9997908.1 hypothetical protein [Pseudomonas aeruginosa]EKV0010330.1 hypothetical protein [Pseudomonas aeruginosa]KSR23770.1 hypothetical protein APB49_16370 [Pseudomonas aeruginosa]OTI16049.1 hypothetical protein CAZ07_31505 [Pseudomonas aeruginosa]RPV35827.1 hypothetical protein IPC856_29605 [Pseudomonas aeruginosa]